jgi:hypothetical protein
MEKALDQIIGKPYSPSQSVARHIMICPYANGRSGDPFAVAAEAPALR